MASLNMFQGIGNVGKDPEIRSFNSGDKVANFSLAMTEKWKDKQSGDKKEKTEWLNVAVFGDGLVGVIERYVKKGSQIYVQGAIQTRKYEKDGSDRYATELVVRGMNGKIVLLGSKGDGDRSDSNSGGYSSQSGGGGGGYSEPAQQSAAYDIDDPIPF